jgi:hypothetical protein
MGIALIFLFACAILPEFIWTASISLKVVLSGMILFILGYSLCLSASIPIRAWRQAA